MERKKDASTVELTIPVQLKRCGIETHLVVGNETQSAAHPESITALQRAVKKALHWNQELVLGEMPSMKVLAKREGITQRYLARLIKLAFLAPDIIQAILRGNVPAGLSLTKLQKGFPLDWNSQRETLGFTR